MEMEQMSVNSRQLVHGRIEKNDCFVNVSVRVKPNDFVIVSDKKDNIVRVAKIETVHGGCALVIWYKSPEELPAETIRKSDNGSEIRFHSKELIEDPTTSENVDLSQICGKCKVIKAHENDSVEAKLQSATRSATTQMAYVCRYKLVKKTCYKLVPVSWLPGEEEMCQTDDTCTDTDGESVCDLNTKIEQIHLSLKTVSPFKIVDNKVKRLTRISTRGHSSPPKRASPDATSENENVSPNKRGRLRSEYETPAGRNGRYASPSHVSLTKAKKNLKNSFTQSPSQEDEQPYTSIASVVNPLKMVISRTQTTRALKENNFSNTPSTRRSMLKKPDAAQKDTPNRNVSFVEPPKAATKKLTDVLSTPRRASSRISVIKTNEAISSTIAAEQDSPDVQKQPTRRSTVKHLSPPSTPKSVSKRTAKTPSTPKGVMTPQQSRSLYRSGNLTPSMQSRQASIGGEQTELEMIRERLQVSAVPKSLPCREKEYSSIYEFITGKLMDGTGGCIYISGVPGTGKTATVTQVIKAIQLESKPRKLQAFDYVDINGMRLTEPRQAYVQIYRQLTGKTMAWAQARDLLEERFTAGAKKAIRPTILLVDELDIICNRKQDVVYNLFDWTVRKGSRLIAITIANTMDLPERVLKLKVASRLGLTRITFQPYTFKQLQEVVMARLSGSKCFMAEAVQLVARKVASVSGDCRRALDICRRATEIAEEKADGSGRIEVNFAHINQALNEMFTSPKVRAIKNCTKFEKLFLQAVASEITRTGIEEVEFHRVYWQVSTLAPVLGIKHPPTEDQAMLICMTLTANRLIIAEDSSTGLYQKIILNATVDDLYYALNTS